VKIIKKVTETVVRDEVTDVRCNLCGETCVAAGCANGASVTTSGGWGGSFPPDMERWTLDVCEHCVGALFLVCKIQPGVYDALDGEPDTQPSGPVSAMLAGEVPCDDSRAVVARLEMIVASATARLASIKQQEAT
jgi:hypothetical protein